MKNRNTELTQLVEDPDEVCPSLVNMSIHSHLSYNRTLTRGLNHKANIIRFYEAENSIARDAKRTALN